MLYKKPYTIIYFLITIVYIIGMFLPLMENDSAQHAVMAMRMYLENDPFAFFRGSVPYLDKPHLHFWLAALSFKIFGLYDWAYRVPSLIFTVIGAISCYGLSKKLYAESIAHLAAIIFLTSMSVILASHDVRTDAILTGAVIFSVWQLYLYTQTKKLLPYILGAAGIGIAFSTKGFFGVAVICFSLIFHLLYTRNLKVIFNYKTLIALVVLAITVSPVLYAYYVQFGSEGVQFILWNQNVNRITSTGFAESRANDYAFFFHTLLWVFFPWALLMYTGLFYRIKKLIKTGFRLDPGLEVLSFAGVLIILFILSFSKFKLPHYLNPLLPLLSIFTAGYLFSLERKGKIKTLIILQYIQYFLIAVGVFAIFWVLFFTFTFPKWYILTGIIVILFILIKSLLKNPDHLSRTVISSALLMLFINFGLNSYFYPNLLQFQGGIHIAKIVQENNIPKESIFIHGKQYSWTLDFYIQRNNPEITTEQIKSLNKDIWLYTDKKESLLELEENNIKFSKEYEADHFRVSKLTSKFLDPATRKSKLGKSYLLYIAMNQ